MTRRPSIRRKGKDPSLVILARFLSPWRADLALGLLESEGIEAFLADDHLARNEPVSSALAGGIRLLVLEEDLTRAREVLDQAENGNLALPPWEGDPHSIPPRERAADAGEVRCPRCGSSHVERGAGLMALFVPRFRCRVCGRNWR